MEETQAKVIKIISEQLGKDESEINMNSNFIEDLDAATIKGTQTAGGAASMSKIVLPDGSVISASQNKVFTNTNQEIIEFGITPTEE